MIGPRRGWRTEGLDRSLTPSLEPSQVVRLSRMAIYFTDYTDGNDANDGLDNLGVGVVTATWTESTLTLTQVGLSYTFSAGDLIYITGGTGATVGLYEVESGSGTDIVLVETTTLPGVTNGSDFAAGDLATGDIGSSDGPWKTGEMAMNNVAAGDIVYMRSTSDYPELMYVDTAGTITAPIRFRGYTTVITDRDKATIDGGSSRGNCIGASLGAVGIYYVFENLILQDATGNGFGVSSHNILFRNCEFNGNGSDGLAAGDGVHCESCIFSGNGTKGADAGIDCGFYGCTFLSNGVDGAEITSGEFIDCLFYNTGSRAIEFIGTNGAACTVYGCTIDGNAKSTQLGIRFPFSFWHWPVVINTIIYDCVLGIGGYGSGGRFISRNNLLNNNTTDYDAGFETTLGLVTSAPGFTDESSQDYTLGDGSPAIDAGFDGYETHGSTQSRDIGFVEKAGDVGGGGGLLAPNKRGGKQ